jgi:hypothetical protein
MVSEKWNEGKKRREVKMKNCKRSMELSREIGNRVPELEAHVWIYEILLPREIWPGAS